MVDFLGRPLAVGDVVVFVITWRSGNELKRGRITRLLKTMAVMEFDYLRECHNGAYVDKKERKASYNKIVKVNE